MNDCLKLEQTTFPKRTWLCYESFGAVHLKAMCRAGAPAVSIKMEPALALRIGAHMLRLGLQARTGENLAELTPSELLSMANEVIE